MDFASIANICYIVNEKGEVLLQKKSRGFGVGKWNGPGGKSKEGEDVEDAVRREVEEETGLIVKGLEKIGELEFIFHGKPEWNNYCHVFQCRDFEGEPEDKGEGELRWFKKEEIPLDKMWDDDRYWLLDALSGNFARKRFNFDSEGKMIDFEDIIG